jgi:hypothetical protein
MLAHAGNYTPSALLAVPGLTKNGSRLELNHNGISGSKNRLAELHEVNVPSECLKICVDNDFHDASTV